MKKIFLLYLLLTVISLIAFSSGAINRTFEFWFTSLIYFIFGLLTNYTISKLKINKIKYMTFVISPYYLLVILTLFVSNNISKSVYPILFTPFISFIIGYYISILQHKLLKIVFIIFFVFFSYFLPYKFYPSYFAYITTDYLPGTTFPKVIFEDVSGNKYKIDDNKIVVIELWQITCSVCYKKMPLFDNIALKYKNNNNIAFYAICLKSKNISDLDIKNRIKKLSYENINFLIADEINSKIIFNNLNFNAVPRFIIIDKNNNVIFSQSAISKESYYKNIFDVIDNELKNYN
jgi:thiol-disulfide isomerase/thioredoxin